LARLRLPRAEALIGLPDHGILITQDLLYAKVHAFDAWSQALRAYLAQPYTRLLPGHGSPAGRELYDAMLEYLAKAREILASVDNGKEMTARLMATFPNHGARVLLEHQQCFLFPSVKAENGPTRTT
jgi:glyoxylase-like metal-dependent hydrolase (beta-lactamase superfamily II)